MKKLTIAQQLAEEKKKTSMQSDSIKGLMADVVALEDEHAKKFAHLTQEVQSVRDNEKAMKAHLTELLGMPSIWDVGAGLTERGAPWFRIFAEIGKLQERASFAHKFEELYARYDELRDMIIETDA